MLGLRRRGSNRRVLHASTSASKQHRRGGSVTHSRVRPGQRDLATRGSMWWRGGLHDTGSIEAPTRGSPMPVPLRLSGTSEWVSVTHSRVRPGQRDHATRGSMWWRGGLHDTESIEAPTRGSPMPVPLRLSGTTAGGPSHTHGSGLVKATTLRAAACGRTAT